MVGEERAVGVAKAGVAVERREDLGPGVAPGGVRREVVQALFSKYDADDSGGISYKEFAAALYDGDLEREAPLPKEYFPPPPQERAHRPGKPCPPENEWMKGGTGVAHALTGGRGWAA